MTSMTRLGLQGFAFGVALTGGGCMPQNQDEIAQLRAELSALKAEVATLKGETTPTSGAQAEGSNVGASGVPAEEAPNATNDSAAATAAASDVKWEEALEKHDKEERDAAWSRLREPDLFAAAKAHIKLYGASLNGVRCKTTSCLITINLPKKPKAEYTPLANPWAQTDAFAHAKPIYSGRTLWSYLLTRHEKDTKEAGAERVNPLDLAAKSPELVRPTVLVAADTETKVATKTAPAKAAPESAKLADANSAGAAQQATPGSAATKPAAQPAATKPAATTKAAEPTKAAVASTKATENTSAAAKTSDAAKATTASKPAEPVKTSESKPAAKTPAPTAAKQPSSGEGTPAAAAAAQTSK